MYMEEVKWTVRAPSKLGTLVTMMRAIRVSGSTCYCHELQGRPGVWVSEASTMEGGVHPKGIQEVPDPWDTPALLHLGRITLGTTCPRMAFPLGSCPPNPGKVVGWYNSLTMLKPWDHFLLQT